MKQTKRHHDAFLYYYELGDKRSLVKAGEKFKISEQSMVKWSKAFDWQKRVIEKDKRIALIQEKKQENTIAQRKVNYQKMIDAQVALFIKNLKGEGMTCPHCEGKINLPRVIINKVEDFEKLLKLDLLLSGEATDIGLVKVEKIHKATNVVVMLIAEYIPVDKLREFTEKLKGMEVLEG